MRVTEKMRKALSILLCLCMLVQNCPVVAFAAHDDNLCEHHTEHTTECGYREGSPGSACTHEHSEGCYKIVACKHTHDDTCSSGCSHTCTVENGCITMELDCHHTHGDCGYAAAVEAHECHYECAECANNELSSRTSPLTCVAIPEGDAQNQEIATSAPDGDLLAMTEAVCNCGTDDPAIHATTCAVYVAPENPQCFCAEKCTEANVWCDICGFDYAKCTGTDTAAAYADDDDLYISGANMSSSTPYLASGSTTASATQPETGGYAYWDAASNTLTLNNFTSATGAMTGIFYGGSAETLRIELEGNNSVTGGNGGSTEVKSGVGVNSDTDIIFSGGGTLTATGTGTGTGNGGGYGVFAWGDITVDSGTTLIATGSSFLSGVHAEGGSIIVNAGGSLTGNGGESGGHGMCADTGITVNGGSLTATANGGSYGVYAGSITVNGGSLTATGNGGDSRGVYAYSGVSLSVSGDSHIVAIGGNGNNILLGDLPEDYYYASGDGTDKTFTHSADALLTGTVYQRYFELVTAQHLSNAYTSNGDDTHSRYCSCEIPTKVIASEACSGGSATCTDKAVCGVCRGSYGELAPNNHASTEFTYAANEDGTTHKKMHKCCSAVAAEAENHTGGTATCKDKAVCDTCGVSYGEVDANNHTPGENADYTDNGNGEHSYTCTVCGTTVTEAHTYVDGTCACGLVKTYTITLHEETVGAKIVEINGEAKEILPGGTFTVPHGKDLTVKFENTLSQKETGVKCGAYGDETYLSTIDNQYDEATNIMTISANKVNRDIFIGATPYVSVQFDLHGGTLTEDGEDNFNHYGCAWNAETSTLKVYYDRIWYLPDFFQLAGHTFAGMKVDGSDDVVQSLDFHSDMTVDILWQCDGTATLTPVPAKDATCMEAGNIAHYVCTCGKLYAEDKTTLLTEAEVKTDIDPTNHVGMDTATGKCACDYQFGFYVERDIEIDGIYHETYWFDNLSDALSYAHGSTDYGQYTTQSATVRLHRDLTIEEGEIFSFRKQVVLDTNSFSVTNSGTLALEGYTYSTIPAAITGGTVTIGDKTYLWSSENEKWICAEGSHVTEQEENKATCTTQAVCDLCGESYGEVDKTNHVSENYTYTDNGDGTHTKTHECGVTVGEPENHTLTYTANGSTITESCSANCGYSASLTLKAPANLVYDRTEKAATVEGEIIADYELTYSADAVIMAGDYTATLTVGDYSVSLAFTIAKADPDVVTPSDLKATYGQTLADVELPGGWAWKNSSASVGSVGSNTFAAIYTPANISNFNTLERDLTVVVAKAMPTVTAPVAADDLVYNGTARPLITAGTATGGTMQYSLDGSIWSETIPTGKDAKTYTVYYKVVGDSNHNDSSVDSVQVTIGKATLTVKADNKTIATGQNLPTFTYTITGFVSGETEDVLTAKPTVVCVADGKTAGTYDITVSGAAADNYEITYVNGTLTVSDHQHAWTYTAKDDTITATCNAEDCPEAEQTITICADGKTYDGKPVTAELEGSIEGVTTPEIIYSGNTNAGTHTASITIEGKTASVEFTIEKATVTVTADAKSKPYGTDNPALTYTASGLVGGYDTLTGALETTATKTSNVGEYDITVGSLAGSNYTINFVGAKLTITKAAAPEIQWPTAAALTYGQKLSDSALTSEDENGTFAWQDGSIVPTVKNNGYVAVYTPKDTDNYDYTVVELTETIPVTVSKAASSIVTAPKANTLTYTGEAQELITAGEAKGGTMQYSTDNQTWSTTIPQGADAGKYTVYYRVVGDANHSDTAVDSVEVTIAKAELTAVISGSVTKTYDGTNTVPSGHGLSIALSTPVANDEVNASATFAYDGVNVGTTKINATGITLNGTDAGNYKLTNTTASADAGTITKAEAVCTAPAAAANLVYNGNSHNLVTAGTATGGTMQYSLDSETWTSTIPTGKDAKTYTVYYKIVGDTNHNDVATATVTVTIAKATAPAAEIPVQKHFHDYVTENAMDLTQYLPADRGETTYTLGTITGNFFADGTTVTETGSLTYTTKVMDAAATGSIAVNVVMENYVNVTLTVPVELAAVTAQTESRIVKSDLTEVPAGLANTAFNTLEKIKAEQQRVLALLLGQDPRGNIVHYDVKLQLSPDGGKTWVDATEENFPKSGLTVTLPYPSGTGKDSHNFVVSHMFTAGNKAGTTETPAVTKTADGIRFTVTGLSPVSVAWSAIAFDVNIAKVTNGTVYASPAHTTAGTQVTITVTPKSGYKLSTLVVKDAAGNSCTVSTDNDGKYYFTMPAADVTVTATFKKISTAVADTTNPKTGDDFQILIWSSMMMTALMGMAILMLNKKKFFER